MDDLAIREAALRLAISACGSAGVPGDVGVQWVMEVAEKFESYLRGPKEFEEVIAPTAGGPAWKENRGL